MRDATETRVIPRRMRYTTLTKPIIIYYCPVKSRLCEVGNMKSNRYSVQNILVRECDRFPNNDKLPLLLYSGVFDSAESSNLWAEKIEALLSLNKWPGQWRGGVLPRHHYHSIAHEVLGVYNGWALVQFGGEEGPKVRVESGDGVVIPAGVAHKLIRSSADFAVVGGYPVGQSPDMQYGIEGERPDADVRIGNVSFPETDPMYGAEGPMMEYWKIGYTKV
jgi:uncharacterized protein YjlB